MKPIFQLIAKDEKHDRESWSFMAVIHFTGDLAENPEVRDQVSDEQIQEIYQFLAGYDIPVRSAGNGGAGQAFADEPWIDFYPNHLIIRQHGGLDV